MGIIMNKKTIHILLVLCAVAVGVIAYLYKEGATQILLYMFSSFVVLIGLFSSTKTEEKSQEKVKTTPIVEGQVTELALLNDENKAIAYWGMYGKSSLVLGLDVGENNVDINLLHSTYASTIDMEHAVLNYSADKWYVEDLGSQNGTSVVKSDNKKYKLTIGKPCLVEKGDIIYISLTKLKLC